MLNEKICDLREKLNESIIKGEDYSIIYQLSIELDELIAQYYRDVKVETMINILKWKKNVRNFYNL